MLDIAGTQAAFPVSRQALPITRQAVDIQVQNLLLSQPNNSMGP